VNGGRTEEGAQITPISLSDSPLVVEYYFTYGLALARTNQCGEALQIAQKVQTIVAEDDETALFAASEIIRICEENLENPPAETSVLDADETTTPAAEITPTP
jgi:hypothetical protein